MATYGLTIDGFILKRLPEIKADIDQYLRNTLGDVNVNPDSMFGQINGIYAKFHTDLWELAQMVYHSQYPNSAEGIALDNVVSLNGITRLEQTKTAVIAAIQGTEGTVVNAGSRFKTTDYANIFISTVLATITKNSLLKTHIALSTTAGTVTINGIPIFINVVSGTVEATIDGLVVLINQNSALSNYVLASKIIVNAVPILQIQTKIQTKIFTVSVGSTMTIQTIWSICHCQAENYGAVLCAAGTLTEIVTGVSGLLSVTNFWDGSLGRLNETDTELRSRREKSMMLAGSATIEAIRTQIEAQVDGVSTVIVYENDHDTTEPSDDGRLPHTIEALVDGGDDMAIAKAIWDSKAGGIGTYGAGVGSVTQIVFDSMGYQHAIRFSRPVIKYGWIKIVYALYPEEIFPNDGVSAIQTAIAEYGKQFKIGENLLRQRFYMPLFGAVTGIKSATIYIDITTASTDTPTWQNIDELSVDSRTRIVFIDDATHILVVQAV